MNHPLEEIPEEQPRSGAPLEPPDASGGMGPNPSGPSFTPWRTDRNAAAGYLNVRGPAPLGRMPVPAPKAAIFSPPRSKRPAAITAVAVLLVSLVVLASTLVANRADSQLTIPTPPVVATRSTGPQRMDSIEFSSPTGTGKLVVLDHAWRSARSQRPVSGSFLQVQVELICLSGQIDYDPFYFQAFDATGELFDVTDAGSPAQLLETGRLGPNQRVRGSIAFDMPRGEVTLLLSDDSAASLTALKIPD